KIKTFLANFPDDPRGDALRAMQDELKQGHPVQRAYTEAKRYVPINPELALAKFGGLIDVYDEGAENSDVVKYYVQLARQQQSRVQKQIDAYAAESRKLIESRLTRAQAIAAGNPEGARKIHRGVIELYGEKPWAADLVEQAKTELANAPDPSATAK